ncbi:MAG: T9SS type A sorting domain-containing protein [Calditrichaeota bacterium]|nr:T9SS type A sorting domain-containing protein [Calditrichota bacterium]
MSAALFAQTPADAPYPVIFIHGLDSKNSTWSETIDVVENTWGNHGSTDVFHAVLNAFEDNTDVYVDVLAAFPENNFLSPTGNIFAINFNNFWNEDPNNPQLIKYGDGAPGISESDGNESAIVKQAYALKQLIAKVITVTGSGKVILVGHSMGGLAAREYLQRLEVGSPKWWVDPNSKDGHKVAKLVTIGTPHRGSNFLEWQLSGEQNSGKPDDLSAVNFNSEAVRDLRYSYAPFQYGRFLFGGAENDPIFLSQNFHNTDVNCDGDAEDVVIGLNEGNNGTIANSTMPLPTNILYTWITSNYPLTPGGDFIVDLSRQWLYQGSTPHPAGLADTLLTNRIHWEETTDHKTIIRGLDEPDAPAFAYPVIANNTIAGFITYGSHRRTYDADCYVFENNTAGKVNVTIENNGSGVRRIQITNQFHQLVYREEIPEGQSTVSAEVGAGTCYITVSGYANTNTWENPYRLTVTTGGVVAPDQLLAAGEYFFDDDPGFGNGTPVAFATDSLADISLIVPVIALEPGAHNLYFRVRETDGLWGIVQRRTLLISPVNRDTPNPDIIAGEYFFDDDPGFGGGTSVTIMPDRMVEVSAVANTAELQPGVHQLYFRTKDVRGLWSVAQGRGVFVSEINRDTPKPDITAAEYFFDNDPGFGNGLSVAITPDSSIEKSLVAAVSGLSSGIHQLYVRTKDARGLWGIAQPRPAMIAPDNGVSPLLTAAEYFIDNDPGFGNASPIAFSPATEIDINRLLPVSGITGGTHRFFARVQNAAGNWSIAQRDTFALGDAAVLSLSQDGFSFEAFTGDSALISDTLIIYNFGNLALEWHVETNPAAIPNIPQLHTPVDNGSQKIGKKRQQLISAFTNSVEKSEPEQLLSVVSKISNVPKKPAKKAAKFVNLLCPWLTIQPDSGMISPGDSAILQLTIDPAGLPGNNLYHCEIQIGSNDPEHPLVALPVDLNVIFVNHPPEITGILPDINFAEDDSIDYPISNWFTFVNDPDVPPDQLAYTILPGNTVSVTRLDSLFRFAATANWFGNDTLLLIVSDNFESDTAAFSVSVSSVNDPPVIISLPDSVYFRADSSATLLLWNFVDDIETPDVELQFSFDATTDSLIYDFNPANGLLTLSTIPQFGGEVQLTITVTDDSNAVAEAAIWVTVDAPVGINSSENVIPENFVLMQNYPNPFNPTTRIRYGLPRSETVELIIYSMNGQKLCTLVSGEKTAGFHTVEWNGTNDSGEKVASGIYIYRIHAGAFSKAKKIILMK